MDTHISEWDIKEQDIRHQFNQMNKIAEYYRRKIMEIDSESKETKGYWVCQHCGLLNKSRKQCVGCNKIPTFAISTYTVRTIGKK